MMGWLINLLMTTSATITKYDGIVQDKLKQCTKIYLREMTSVLLLIRMKTHSINFGIYLIVPYREYGAIPLCFSKVNKCYGQLNTYIECKTNGLRIMLIFF